MRGVVTLAAATGIPLTTASGAPFPAGTRSSSSRSPRRSAPRAIQGLTLPTQIRKLKVSDTGEAARDENEELEARSAAMNAALRRLDEIMPELLSTVDISKERAEKPATRLRALVETRYRGAVAAISLSAEDREANPHAAFVKARKELLIARREAVLAKRNAGNLDDDVLRKVLRELDLEKLSLSATLTSRLT